MLSSKTKLEEAQGQFLANVKLVVHLEMPMNHRNLVFVQCRHDYRRASVVSADRGFDVMLNFFDRVSIREADELPSVDIVTAQYGTKCSAIHTILTKLPHLLLRYDHVLFLDDDIAIETRDIELLFALAEEDRLDLCQPSLSPESHVAWPSLRQPAVGSSTVMASAVEIMMPCLSRTALSVGGWVFGTSISGYGADVLLSAYLSRTRETNSYVLGQVIAHHERPIDQSNGALYRYLREAQIDPIGELSLLKERYGIEGRIWRIHPL